MSAKDKLPWLKLAVFGDERTRNNSLRHNANVKEISGVEVDYDAKEMTFEEAVARCDRAQLMALLPKLWLGPPRLTRASALNSWRCPHLIFGAALAS
jgi:hypothetical protein